MRRSPRRWAAAALAVALAGCGGGEPPSPEPLRRPHSAPTHLFAPAVRWSWSRAPGAILPPEQVALFSGPTVALADEPLARRAWYRGAGRPDRPDLKFWEARPRFAIQAAGGGLRAGGRLHHPRRKLRRAAAGPAGIAAGSFAVLTTGVILALPAGKGPPDGEFTLSYPADPGEVLGVLGSFLAPPSTAPLPRSITLGFQARPAVALPPPGALCALVRIPPAAQLRLGFGFRRRGWTRAADGLRETSGASDGVGFRVRLRDGSGGAREVWQRFLTPAEGDRFHDACIDLSRWAGEEVELEIATFASAVGTQGGPSTRDDFAYLAEPFLAPAEGGTRQRPNVLIVLVDTLRADALGCYGNPRPLTPNLDALAREGVLFELARSPSSWTLPAHVSLFTSLQPIQHGVVHGADRMPAGLATLAGELRAAGWRTAAFTDSGFLSPAFGLEAGFDHFDFSSGGIALVAGRAWEWLRSCRQPWFVFVHTYQVHAPYNPPEPQRSRWVRPYGGPLGKRVTDRDLSEPMLANEREPTEADRRYAHDLYEGEVALTDAVLGAFFDLLRGAGTLDRTLLFVTSDHGEEFGEHGDYGHRRSLYEEVLRIPLLVRLGGSFEGGRRVGAAVQLVDLAPTVMEALDLPVPPEWVGRSLRDTAIQRHLFASLTLDHGGARARAIFRGTSKWIETTTGFYRTGGHAQGERFDLAADPAERRNLWGDGDAERFEQRWRALLGLHPDRSGGRSLAPPPLSRLQASALRGLGYLRGSKAP